MAYLKSFVLLTCLLFTSTANAQFGDQNIISDTSDYVNAALIFDMDNDGDKDLIVGEYYGVIRYWENDGNGAFLPGQTLIDFGGGINSLATGDIDLDGKVDLVACVYLDGLNLAFLVWVKNLGNGVFAPLSMISASYPKCNSINILDYDQDGDMDLLANFPNTGGIALLENDGNESFAFPEALQPNEFSLHSASVREFELADVNGDAQKDICFYTNDGRIGSLTNTGNYNFGSIEQLFNTNETISSMKVADMDNNGFSDFVVTSVSGGWLRRYDNANGMVDSLNFQTITASYLPEGLELQDFNGDGYMDITFVERYIDVILVYLSEQAGTDYSSTIIVTGDVITPRVVRGADLNGNNKIDILSGSGGDDKLAWYENLYAVGLNELNESNNISVYPNPVKDCITIRIPDFDTIDASIVFTRSTGEGVFSDQLSNCLSRQDNANISVEHFSPGMYILTIEEKGVIYGSEMIVVK